MTTEQIITNILFMPGYREVILGTSDEEVGFELGGDFGSFFKPGDCILANMAEAMADWSRGKDYLTIRHWPKRKGRSVLYCFLPVRGQWMPLTEAGVRRQMAGAKLKNCRPAMMEE